MASQNTRQSTPSFQIRSGPAEMAVLGPVHYQVIDQVGTWLTGCHDLIQQQHNFNSSGQRMPLAQSPNTFPSGYSCSTLLSFSRVCISENCQTLNPQSILMPITFFAFCFLFKVGTQVSYVMICKESRCAVKMTDG